MSSYVNKSYLTRAIALKNKNISLHQNIRRLKGRAAKLNLELHQISQTLIDNNLFYCEVCDVWFSPTKQTDSDSPLFGNKCEKCAEDYKITCLAKSSICNSGLSLRNVPDELVEIQKLIIKTKHKIKNHGNNS